MTPDRALKINSALVGAFMVRDALRDAPVPDVTWFSPTEAEEASVMMRDTDIGRTRNADGGTTLTCFVEPTRVRSLYAWALGRMLAGLPNPSP